MKAGLPEEERLPGAITNCTRMEEVVILASPPPPLESPRLRSSMESMRNSACFFLGAYAPRRALTDVSAFSNSLTYPSLSSHHDSSQTEQISSIRSIWNLPDDVVVSGVHSALEPDLFNSSLVCTEAVSDESCSCSSLEQDGTGYISAEEFQVESTSGPFEQRVDVLHNGDVDNVFTRTDGRRSRKTRGGPVIIEYSPEEDTVLRNIVRCVERKPY